MSDKIDDELHIDAF